ncbi:MAG: outer membrane protein assembly factor BamA [Deltaproteobacteria bacterium]|nr:outer membrane protein assembly factor BamA [Deltaproteobacteria bacterium]
MNKRIILGVFFLLLTHAALLPGKAWGQEVVKIGLIPFRVYAADQATVENWPQQAAKTLSTELAKDDRIILVEEEKIKGALTRFGRMEPEEQQIRAIGAAVDADYIVYGSATRINGSISLDARILDVHQPQAFVSAFAEGKDPESLEQIAGRLSREISVKILKKELAAKVLIEGNKAIDESAIRAQIKLKDGDILSPRSVREDLKIIYQMGYFQDVRAEKRDWVRGKAIVFIVEEKPVIKEIKFKGNKAIKISELQEVIDLKPRTVLNLNVVKESMNKILQKYREEAFFAAEVKYELETPRPGEAIVLYHIQEHKKIRIRNIKFSGNAHFSDEQLKKLLPETKEESFFSWMTKAGTFKEETLERDLDALVAFYMQKGFFQMKVGKPQVTHDQHQLSVVIPIEEGRQFRVGKVDIIGDLITLREDLFKLIHVHPGEILNRDKVRDSISQLTDEYADKGYAFVDVSPQTIFYKEHNLVDLIFDIHKGSKVYFERINIMGNTKTRDKVIRRELKAVEGELYSLSSLKKSRENLNILRYFNEINLSSKKGSADDKLDLNVQVEEAPTGMLSVGAGYSSIDQFMAMVQISQANLFGRGQKLSLSAQLGAISQYYNLSFTEPWLFDTRVSAGGDIYRTRREYTDYTVLKSGGGVRFGFPLFEYVRGYSSYKYEQVDISDVKDAASILIQEQVGTSTTSSVSAALRRDTRDNFLEPSKGSDNSVSVEYAGGQLGGSNFFTRYSASSAWFTTPFWKMTFMGRGRIGFIQGNEGHTIPLYERYRLGGINTVRGFKAFTIGPKAATGEVIGGDKELLFNFEATFPLIPGIKLKGLIFFDAGNAFDIGEPYRMENLRTSVGGGLRWISPIGPLRLEWGYNLSPKEDEQRQGWEFSIGTFF